MSNQMHLIMSETIKGVGLMQGASFGIHFFIDPDDLDSVDVDTIIEGSLEKAAEFVQNDLIDDTANIEGAPVYIYSGTLNDVAPTKFQQAQRDIYESYGANAVYEEDDYWHVLPVDSDIIPANECTEECSGKMVCNCGNDRNDMAGSILSNLLTNIPATDIEELAPKDLDFESKGVWRLFKQGEFTDDGWGVESGFKKYGYEFYPNQCLQMSCHNHFLLHGCDT